MVAPKNGSLPLRIRAADILLVVLFIALSIFTFYHTRHRYQSGRFYLIEIEGTLLYRMPLHTDTLLCLTGTTGPFSVQASGAKVRVLKTTCPAKICKRTGWIQKPGESIICVPNALSITIEGTKQGTIDAITK